jgi:glycosyltransferase involved in cell wall biosynthesis
VTIKKYLENRWRPRRVEYIAYGIRELPKIDVNRKIEILKRLGLERNRYYLTIGRIVAENNIHLEIEAFKKTKTDDKLVIVGPINPRDPYVKHLFRLREGDKRIIFTGGIYDPGTIYTLRSECKAYIHPYTVGGTNPSLLEQLQFNKPIIAYDVPFHREILKDKATYFKTKEELTRIIEDLEKQNTIRVDREKPHILTWERVTDRYRKIFKSLMLLKR